MSYLGRSSHHLRTCMYVVIMCNSRCIRKEFGFMCFVGGLSVMCWFAPEYGYLGFYCIWLDIRTYRYVRVPIDNYSRLVCLAATWWTAINLEISLKVMHNWAYLTCFLMAWLNCSISGIFSSLDAQFRDMPRLAVSSRTGLNLLSECIHVILKPCCRYSFWTCLNSSSMLFIFRFLIILPVANILF